MPFHGRCRFTGGRGFAMTVPVWVTPISMVVYTVLLMLLTEFMRRHYRTSMWVWVVSLVTIPLWIANIPGDDWFRWAKNLSVILPLIFAGLGRIAAVEQKDTPFWRTMRKRWVRWVLYGIVFCNIAEATLRDVQMGNMMNALAGFILCVTMPFGDKFWKYDTSSHGEILSYTVPMWNFLYTTWNACFVYAEGHEFFASTCCILAAAELYPIVMRRPELYITGRIYTLGAHLLLRSCFPLLFPTIMNSAAWFNPDFMAGWGLFNGIIGIPFVFWYCYQLHTGRADVAFRRGKARAVYLEGRANGTIDEYGDPSVVQRVEGGVVAAGAVAKAFRHARDGSGRGARGLLDGGVGLAGIQQARHGQPLRGLLDLADGEQVLQQRVDGVLVIERGEHAQQVLHLRRPEIAHATSPFSSGRTLLSRPVRSMTPR